MYFLLKRRISQLTIVALLTTTQFYEEISIMTSVCCGLMAAVSFQSKGSKRTGQECYEFLCIFSVT